MLLLGGGISGEGKALTDPMNEYGKAHCFGGDNSFVTRVDAATVVNNAGIIGAAALCLSAPAAMPLKLAPAFKDYLWGGERLKSEYGKHTRLSPLAESWELSCHKDGPSTIQHGITDAAHNSPHSAAYADKNILDPEADHVQHIADSVAAVQVLHVTGCLAAVIAALFFLR